MRRLPRRHDSDAESIADACKDVQKRIGAGLTIMLFRAWPYDIDNFEIVEDYESSWMWDEPTQADIEHVREGLATADEKIRVPIADRIDPNGENVLLEKIRYAASFLPQRRENIVKKEVGEP